MQFLEKHEPISLEFFNFKPKERRKQSQEKETGIGIVL